MQNKKLVAAFFVALILVSGIIFTHFFKSEASIAREDDSLKATGTIEADSVKASFKVAGRIETMLVKEGDKVEKGQVLAILDTTEIEAKVAQAQGAYEAAKSQSDQANLAVDMTKETVEAKISQVEAKIAQAEIALKNAQQTYDRIAALHESGVATDAQFDEASNNLQAKKDQLSEAKAGLEEAVASRASIDIAQAKYEAALGQSRQGAGALAEAQSYLDNARLTAPISGYITQKYLDVGEICGAGTPILEISDLEHTYVKVFFSETKIGRINLQQKAKVFTAAQPEKPFEGEVIWINNAGDFAVKKAVNDLTEHDVRSFEVKIDLPNPNLVLKTGMTATVEIAEEGEKGGGNN